MNAAKPAPDLRHPAWCDPQQCEAGADQLGYHRSPPLPFADDRDRGGVDGTVQAWKYSAEPLDEGRPSVVVTFDQSLLHPMVMSFDLPPEQVRQLVDALLVLDGQLRRGGVR